MQLAVECSSTLQVHRLSLEYTWDAPQITEVCPSFVNVTYGTPNPGNLSRDLDN